MSNSCHMRCGHALRWARGCLVRGGLIVGEVGRGGMRVAVGVKTRRKQQNRKRSNHKTKPQRLSLDKCISMYHLATTYFHSSVVKFQFRHGKRPGDLRGLLGLLMLLCVECKNRNTGRYYPACHSSPRGLLCVCSAYTPPWSRRRLRGTVPHGVMWVALCLKSPSLRQCGHSRAKFLLREQIP